MAQYWVYLNNDVAGPYGVEQLIRLRGFSRQTLVCVDDSSGKPSNWISPAEIPELAPIFRAADEQQSTSPMDASSKAAPKPTLPRPVAKHHNPAASAPRPAVKKTPAWPWLMFVALAIGGGLFGGLKWAGRGAQARERETAQGLVENAPLPSTSLYATLRQYVQDKSIHPRWEFERQEEALYRVTASWSVGTASTVYAFETNAQAQTVRGLNTAAIRLLSDGFSAPTSSKQKAAPAPKISPSELFPQASDNRREAIESGDFPAVWKTFSQRKKAEMANSGMSQDGFIRFQNLTYHVDSAVKQAIVKTKSESDTEMLVLVKQTQAGRPDIFIKQFWVFENGEWKLDDEDKRVAPGSAPAAAPAGSPLPPAPSASSPSSSAPSAANPTPGPGTAPAKPAAASLPGMSN